MSEITCFIMNNLLGQDFIDIERIYDLKGSTAGRKVQLTPEETKTKSGLKVLKDINFVELKEQLDIDSEQRDEIMTTLARDSQFLAENKLMDYSLLFIKVAQKQAAHSLRRMPAMVYVQNDDGFSMLALREVDTVAPSFMHNRPKG